MLNKENNNVLLLTSIIIADARSIIGRNARLISNMFYFNLSYIQSDEFVEFNNTLDTKDCSTVNMINELRDTLHCAFEIVGFNNDELNYILFSLCCA